MTDGIGPASVNPTLDPLTQHNNIVIMAGTVWEIQYFETANGRRPVQEFVDALDARSKAKIARTLDLLEELGVKLGMPYAKHVEGDMWEIRTRVGSNQYRIIYFLFAGGAFILLHGLLKKSGQIPQRDLRMARDRRTESLKRGRRS